MFDQAKVATGVFSELQNKEEEIRREMNQKSLTGCALTLRLLVDDTTSSRFKYI